MRVRAAFLADHAEALPTGLFLAGAFAEYVKLPSVPARVRIVVALVMEVQPEEASGEFSVDVTLRRVQDGTVLVQGEVPLRRVVRHDHFVADTPLYIHRVVHLHADFEDVGAHEVLLEVDGKQIADVRFGVCLDQAVEPDYTAA